jgi:hypothetical protein
MTQGDILFFYHTVAARHRSRKLLKIAEHAGDKTIMPILERANVLAEKYSGTIFGYAEIGGAPEFFEDDGPSHFKNKIAAPLGTIGILEVPLPASEFGRYVKIGQNTITPLGKREFNGIRHLISKDNDVSTHLADAEFGEVSFRNISRDSWRQVSCADSTRFCYELQLRSYLADYLLNEIKDPGTTVLQECQCYRKGQSTGYADYFVRIHGSWLPVETKLNIAAERDLPGQLRKYIHIELMKPCTGHCRGKEFLLSDSSICVVIDQAGVYSTIDGAFAKCSENRPLWRRTDLSRIAASEIRNHIGSLMDVKRK